MRSGRALLIGLLVGGVVGVGIGMAGTLYIMRDEIAAGNSALYDSPPPTSTGCIETDKVKCPYGNSVPTVSTGSGDPAANAVQNAPAEKVGQPVMTGNNPVTTGSDPVTTGEPAPNAVNGTSPPTTGTGSGEPTTGTGSAPLDAGTDSK